MFFNLVKFLNQYHYMSQDLSTLPQENKSWTQIVMTLSKKSELDWRELEPCLRQTWLNSRDGLSWTVEGVLKNSWAYYNSSLIPCTKGAVNQNGYSCSRIPICRGEKKLPLHVKVTAPPHVMKVGQHLTRPFDNSSLLAWFPSNLYLLSSKLNSYISAKFN